jgi:hypothetical protein
LLDNYNATNKLFKPYLRSGTGLMYLADILQKNWIPRAGFSSVPLSNDNPIKYLKPPFFYVYYVLMLFLINWFGFRKNKVGIVISCFDN